MGEGEGCYPESQLNTLSGNYFIPNRAPQPLTQRNHASAFQLGLLKAKEERTFLTAIHLATQQLQANFILLRFTLLHFVGIAFFTNWGFVATVSRASCWHHFSNWICSLCVIAFWKFKTFSFLLLYFLWWFVISALWCYYYNRFGVPWTVPI